MFMTAEVIRRDLEQARKCDGLDEWITSTLFPKFLNTKSNSTIVEYGEWADAGWSRDEFVTAMRLRGFGVDWTCGDFPGARPFFTITV